METFLYVAICFALVALGFSAGMLVKSTQKDTFENYFGAVLGEMIEQTRRIEKLSLEVELLMSKTYTRENIPMAEEIEDDYYSSPVSYTHLRAQETAAAIVCRLMLEK